MSENIVVTKDPEDDFDTNGSAILIEDLSFYYPDTKVPALSDINLRIKKGEFVLLVGQSGSGKSTLVKCLNGLIPHKSKHAILEGQISLHGKNTRKMKIRDISQIVGTVFQNPDEQFFSLNVDSELAFGPENLGVPPEEIGERIKQAMKWVELEGYGKKQIFMLSGGQKQRVAIGSTLTMGPDIIILDEPTSDLDPQGTEEVMKIIKRISRENNATIILVEHKLEDVAQHADRVVLLQNGKITVNSPPQEAFKEYVRFEKEGVSIPQVCQIGISMQQLGFNIPQIPLNVEECVEYLKNMQPKRTKLEQTASVHVDKSKPPMIEILDLWHIYRDGTVAAKDVSFKLYPGEFIGMIGQNGAGKSTILSHIIGLLKPSRGSILVDQQNVSSISVGKIAETVGYVYQNPDLMLFTNQVISELEFAPKNTKVPSYPVLLGTHKNLEIENKMKGKTDKIPQYTKIIEALNNKIQKNNEFMNITLGQSKTVKRTISNKSLQAQSIYLSSVLEACEIPSNRKDQAISDIIRESKDIRVLDLSGGRILLFSEKKNIVIDEFMTTITKTAIEILNNKLDNLEIIERYTDQKTIEESKIIDLKKQALDSKEISTILELSEKEIQNKLPEFAAAISGVSLVEIDGVKERVEEGLRIIELEAFSYRHPHALSRGQRHRVAVASVLAMHPKILVLDEPTNGQDYGHTEALMRLVKKISEGGTTVIIISHDMKLIAKYCDRIIVLRKGEILLDGPTNKIFDQNPLLATTNLQSPKVTQVAHLLGNFEDPVLTTEQFIEYYK
ncbi:MAG: energy-coupling factor transporter ATPase [Candidatus Kariarchaeaceae archaeon]|jgi:energy-coupling factor transport system ATP-binding protein